MIFNIRGVKNFFTARKSRTQCPLCYSKEAYLPLSDYYLNKWKQAGFTGFRSAETLSLDSYSCSQCSASDRERLYAYWIFNMIEKGILTKEKKIIHFSPEDALSKKLKELNFKHYFTADYFSDEVDLKIDITKIDLEDNFADFFICSHILEHVSNDEAAVRELYRITKPGGCGILMAPIVLSLDSTIEEERDRPLSEEERWKRFGQNDHVRIYARNDYLNLIRNQGFRVQELNKKNLGDSIFKKLGLSDSSVLYIVTKEKLC